MTRTPRPNAGARATPFRPASSSPTNRYLRRGARAGAAVHPRLLDDAYRAEIEQVTAGARATVHHLRTYLVTLWVALRRTESNCLALAREVHEQEYRACTAEQALAAAKQEADRQRTRADALQDGVDTLQALATAQEHPDAA